VADLDQMVAVAVDRATVGYLSESQAREALTRELAVLPGGSYDRAHADAILAALCFRLLPDGTFQGDFAGPGPDSWPRVLTGVAPEVLDIWDAYARGLSSAALRARLHDLLAEAGAGSRHQHVQAAVAAYREAVVAYRASDDRTRGQLRAAQSLTRALALTVSMNQRELAGAVVQDMLGLAEDMLSEQPAPIGLIFSLVEPLRSRGLAADAVQSLLVRTHAACPSGAAYLPLRLSTLKLLRSTYGDPADRANIDRQIVADMITSAEASPAMVRLTTLNDAAVYARNTGLSDLAAEATRKMQATPRASLGMVPMAPIQVQLLPEELDAARAPVDQAANLAEALWRIAGTRAPAGDIALAEQAAQLIAPTVPLAASLARGSINPAGPVPVSPPQGDGLAGMSAMYQLLYLERSGLAVSAQLDRIRERFAPDEDALTAVLAHRLLGTESRTRMLVRAFMHYWAGEDDAAIHLALPRVEALLREIERDRGVAIVNVARGKTPGGVSQLGSLISEMPSAGFDANWQRSFELLLTDGENGLNLRNNVGHGLCDCPPRHHVALVLHAALYLLAVANGVVLLSDSDPADEQDSSEAADTRSDVPCSGA